MERAGVMLGLAFRRRHGFIVLPLEIACLHTVPFADSHDGCHGGGTGPVRRFARVTVLEGIATGMVVLGAHLRGELLCGGEARVYGEQ